MTEARWTMYYHRSDLILTDGSTIIPSWSALAPNAVDTAQAICEQYFDDTEWMRNFGAEDVRDTVKLVIHAPAPIAGTYRVALERRTKASAERMIPLIMAAAE